MATVKRSKKSQSKVIVADDPTSPISIVPFPLNPGTGSTSQAAIVSAPRTGRRVSAAAASVKYGGAFAAFVSSKGIDPNYRRPESEWVELLDEFANRPIHGYRRGPGGGNHQRS